MFEGLYVSFSFHKLGVNKSQPFVRKGEPSVGAVFSIFPEIPLNNFWKSCTYGFSKVPVISLELQSYFTGFVAASPWQHKVNMSVIISNNG